MLVFNKLRNYIVYKIEQVFEPYQYFGQTPGCAVRHLINNIEYSLILELSMDSFDYTLNYGLNTYHINFVLKFLTDESAFKSSTCERYYTISVSMNNLVLMYLEPSITNHNIYYISYAGKIQQRKFDNLKKTILNCHRDIRRKYDRYL
jgi:hypothetical protein